MTAMTWCWFSRRHRHSSRSKSAAETDPLLYDELMQRYANVAREFHDIGLWGSSHEDRRKQNPANSGNRWYAVFGNIQSDDLELPPTYVSGIFDLVGVLAFDNFIHAGEGTC
jgi:hypothetical protein